MSDYLDTSVLMAMLTREPGSSAVLDWIAAAETATFCISDWTLTEVASALAGKVRQGHLKASDGTRAQAQFAVMQAEQLACRRVERADFLEAAAICARDGAALRAPDALHLAVAMRIGARLATSDRALAHAAKVHGLAVVAF